MKRNLLAFVLLAGGFFALYALTAQRGLGWGDSGEFQYRVLHCSGLLSGAESYATAHPLYVALAKLVCRTPYHVTLLSSLFGALAVGGFFLCTRQVASAALFGLSHMLWWSSCLAEVQTMSLAFTVFETALVLKSLASGRGVFLVGACFLAGVHLSCHNFALLALPVYGVLAARAGARIFLACLLAGTLGAAPWLAAAVTRGPADVLFGRYGHEVAGVLPQNLIVTGFNFALAALSFAVPVALARWNRRECRADVRPPVVRRTLLALFAINALFFVRYFVPDQATFLLPTLFFAFLLVARAEPRPTRAAAVAALQLLIPILACEVLTQLPQPKDRPPHPHRNEARYFALPWKFADDSADRFAAELGGVWTGYPKGGGQSR